MSADPEDFDDEVNAEPAGPATRIGLMCAILTYIDRHEGGEIDLCRPRGVDLANAVIAAANLVMAELRKPAEVEPDTCGQHMVSVDDADFVPPRRPKCSPDPVHPATPSASGP